VRACADPGPRRSSPAGGEARGRSSALGCADAGPCHASPSGAPPLREARARARRLAGCAHRRAEAEGGFLLLEALIGLAIIGVVAIALLAATGGQIRTSDKAAVLLVAGALAQDRLVSLQVLDQEALQDPPDSLLAGTFPAPFDDFTWAAEVVEAEGEYDLFAVRLQVEGRGEVFPLETLLHRPPVVMAAAGRGGGAAGRGGGGGGGGRGGGRGDAVGRGGGGGEGRAFGPGGGGGRGGGAARGGAGGGRGAGGRGGGAGPPPPRGGGG
jgi:type II secretory pathway pseudopilin PulG